MRHKSLKTALSIVYRFSTIIANVVSYNFVPMFVTNNSVDLMDVSHFQYTMENNIRIIDANKNELHNLEQERKHKEDKHAELDAKLKAFIQECMDMSE